MSKALSNHLAFWVFSAVVLTLIYGVSFGSYQLGAAVILMLLPVHAVYFYSISYWVIPRYFFRQRYIITGLACLTVAFYIAILYRLNEILISDPYIFRFYKNTDPNFTWAKLNGTFWQQVFSPKDFVNAVERSNVIVWIGVSVKFIKMWYERRQAAIQAELDFLKGQVHPHFLFNTLNNLYSLTLNQSKSAPAVVLGLSDILRYMLYECKSDRVQLKRDIEILEAYIALEKIRYEDKLDLNISISGSLADYKIAPLLMLPLVENAFKHGASEMMDDAWISIDIQVSNHKLKFKVSNSKPALIPANANIHFGKIGLNNVRKRLDLIYKGRYQFNSWEEDDMYLVIFELDLAGRALKPDVLYPQDARAENFVQVN
ncbi:MAG: histidine kinase [Bacteroidota bacterium]